MRTFLYRFYPILALIVAMPIATEIGAYHAHFGAALGRPIFPHIYAPWAGLGWIADSGPTHLVQVDASVGFFATELVVAGAVFFQMIVDWAHGRSWGPLNVILTLLAGWSTIDMTLRGFPPSFTWYGKGGVADRESGTGKRR